MDLPFIVFSLTYSQTKKDNIGSVSQLATKSEVPIKQLVDAADWLSKQNSSEFVLICSIEAHSVEGPALNFSAISK